MDASHNPVFEDMPNVLYRSLWTRPLSQIEANAPNLAARYDSSGQLVPSAVVLQLWCSSVPPLRLALFQEGGYALVGVFLEEVVHHHLLGNVVGGGAVQFDLLVEGRFAYG